MRAWSTLGQEVHPGPQQKLTTGPAGSLLGRAWGSEVGVVRLPK